MTSRAGAMTMLIKKTLILSALLTSFSNISIAEEYAEIATKDQVELYHCINDSLNLNQHTDSNDFSSNKDHSSEQEILNSSELRNSFIKCMKQYGSLIMRPKNIKQEDVVALLYTCYIVAVDKNESIKRNKEDYLFKSGYAVRVEMERYGGNSVRIYNDFCAIHEELINSFFMTGS